MKKLWQISTMECYVVLRKNESKQIDCNNGGTRGYHIEQTKSKGEQIPDDITHLQNTKRQKEKKKKRQC